MNKFFIEIESVNGYEFKEDLIKVMLQDCLFELEEILKKEVFENVKVRKDID